MFIPSMILKQLYTNGSLENTNSGIKFSIKNRLKDSTLTQLNGISINGGKILLKDIALDLGDGGTIEADSISKSNPVDFPLKKTLTVVLKTQTLPTGKHEIEISVQAKPFGKIKFSVDDSIVDSKAKVIRIPRSEEDDYGKDIIKERQDFVENNNCFEKYQSNTNPNTHVNKQSFILWCPWAQHK